MIQAAYFKRFLCGLLLVGVFATPAVAVELTPEEAEEIVAGGSARAVAAVAARDLDTFLSSYTDNPRVMPHGMPTLDSSEDIKDFWKGLFDAGMRDLVLTTTRLRVAGDFFIEEGELSFVTGAPGEEPTLHEGKYVVVWEQRADGTWGWGVDIFNGNS